VRDSALHLLQQCIAGKLDYCARKLEKTSPLPLSDFENLMAFQSSAGFVAQQAGRNYPAPMAAVKAMEKSSRMGRDAALEVEARGFAAVAKTPQAAALTGLFLADQAVKKANSAHVRKGAAAIERAAVLGAGIMGGGIAHQSALKGTPIIMKDIAEEALQLGQREANKLLAKRVERGQMDAAKMGEVLGAIRPTLHYTDFGSVDTIIEAVVENEKVKKSVLVEVEGVVGKDTVIASNTSTISITRLATALQRPENFAGMHFFNPVHAMPLVEVIRGEKTSDRTVATLVAYAQKMGKNPIVVNDCPGFLVNRVLFPYFAGFSMLVRDGGDFQAIDAVMERFGWPMGPAYLLDVVGVDTAVHAARVMAEGFPDRMRHEFKGPEEILFEDKRFGQKNGRGFYRYEDDARGKPKKLVDETSYALLQPFVATRREFDADEIIARMMVPLCTETIRCLDDGIVGSAAEADMAMIYGIGFPPFRGGPLRYVDTLGLDTFIAQCEQYQQLGALYTAPDSLRAMAAAGKRFFE
jgi:3-hydroxyacyl-CoA dehydrogenase / enoyl-CoA hydratase / 3-hydroxybutyryl-CoA epimerase / enoyl-CoA isomerase